MAHYSASCDKIRSFLPRTSLCCDTSHPLFTEWPSQLSDQLSWDDNLVFKFALILRNATVTYLVKNNYNDTVILLLC